LGMQILGYKFWNVFDEMVLVTWTKLETRLNFYLDYQFKGVVNNPNKFILTCIWVGFFC
jgi:hypothetical protein